MNVIEILTKGCLPKDMCVLNKVVSVPFEGKLAVVIVVVANALANGFELKSELFW